VVDQVAVVQFTKAAGAGVLDITSPLITETFDCAIILCSGSDSDGTNNTHAIFGIGFCSTNTDGAGVQNVSIGLQIENGVVAVDAGFRNLNGKCINIPAGTDVATVLVDAAFDSVQPGGVRLNFTTATVQVKGVALLFAGLTESVIRQIQPTSTPTAFECPDSAGGSGTFEPDLLVWLTHDHPGGAINEAEGQWSLGFTINDGGSPPQQIASFFNVDEIDPTDADGVARTDVSFGWLNLTTRAQETGGVTTFSANGFTAASSIVGGIRCSFLAIKFSGPFRAAIAQLAVAASTGLQSFNAFGFTPDVVLGLATLLAATDSLTDGPTASAGGYLLTGKYGSRAYTFRQDEGVDLNPTTTAASSRQEDVALLMFDDTGTVVQRATWAGGTGSGGFRMDFSVASAVGTIAALGLQLQRSTPPAHGGRARAAPARQGEARARRFVPLGILRAARYGRMLKAVARNRMLARLAQRRRVIEAVGVEIERVTTDPSRIQGDSAFPGSWKGGSAEAGSVAGDSA